MTDDPQRGSGFTVKESLLRIERDVRDIDSKLDGYIAVHQGQHLAEQSMSAAVRSDPKQSAAGARLLDDIKAVADVHRDTRTIVDRHDVLIQRLFGATTLAGILGFGGMLLVILRIAGWLGG